MERIRKIISDTGLNIIGSNQKYIIINLNKFYLTINIFDLFSMSKNEIIKHIQREFKKNNISVDFTKLKKNVNRNIFTLDQKKKNIREKLSKNKLLK